MRQKLCLILILSCTGCGDFMRVGVGTTTTTKQGDQVEQHQTHWEGSLDELPEGLTTVGSDLASTTQTLVEKLTEVPPPGRIALTDLGPGLASFEGHAETDFLLDAKGEDGKPIRFEYVRLGVANYDAFFRQAQLVYATCVQLVETERRLAGAAGELLQTKVDANAELSATVGRALELQGKAGVDASLVARLQTLRQLAGSLATIASQLAARISELVQIGQTLIATAQASLASPKFVTHLDLVKEGLTQSVSVIATSGELLGSLVVSFGGFASG